MVIVGTKILSGDNSGARFLKVIKVLGSHNNKPATIGNTLVVSVTRSTRRKKIKDHDVCVGLLIRQRKEYRRYIGIWISFFYNYIVLYDKKKNNNPIGTRIFGPYMYELRRKKYIKFLNLATTII